VEAQKGDGDGLLREPAARAAREDRAAQAARDGQDAS